MILTSKNNPLIKETAGLKEKKGRRESGSFLVEGVKMARECQKSDLEIEKIFLTERAFCSSPSFKSICAALSLKEKSTASNPASLTATAAFFKPSDI